MISFLRNLFRRDKTRIIAPRHLPELHHALNTAQAHLNKKHKGGNITVSFRQANHTARSGKFGVIQPNQEVWGGACQGKDMLWLAEKNGKIHPATAAHEFAHAILFSHSIPSERHHDIMQRAGI